METIPLFKPSCSDAEIEAVTRVLKSGWWGLGPETEAFEYEFAEYVGARHAVAVNSGTAALELAARALGVTNGLVVVPALTFVSTALAMKNAGNEIRFADIDEETLCINWDNAQEKLVPGADWVPQAVVPVWYSGTVTEIPDQTALPAAIEDCAHAAGSVGAGVQGDIACWSFQAVKNLATGDGGMITTDARAVADTLRQLRWCGIDRSTWDRGQSTVGYGWDYSIPGDGEKAHMNDITAAIGRVQLSRIDELNSRRRQLARAYTSCLKGVHDWLRPMKYDARSSCHLYYVRVPADHRDRFIRYLLGNKISAGVHYKPLHHYTSVFPGYWDLPVTERVWKELVTLPLYPDLTDEQQDYIIEKVSEFKL